MYSNKTSVNILTSLLVAHGIKHAVVCPGSRNVPIVHNLNECPDITCYPVTDERSAGFYALGMAQALHEPVVVCVTSGTALLNLAPAVAEAWYQHRPIVVISADRPQQWIDQLDGQTLPQSDALGRFVAKAVTLPEDTSCDELHWYCNRLVNEALMHRHAPIHINVPISEPLFGFTTPALPVERKIEWKPADISPAMLSHVTRMFLQAKRPMLISGQPWNPNLDEAVSLVGDNPDYQPDFILYTGGALVSKRAKRFLREARETWVVNETGQVTDTFMNLTHIIQGDSEAVADHIRFMLEAMEPHPFVQRWEGLLARVRSQADAFQPRYSQMAAVKELELRLAQRHSPFSIHYANSSAIRLANIYARHPVFCNRGVNGIEGSLSTAAGFSLVAEETVCCVIGDLSFFYDQNALWNQGLRGNLRILLLNNGGGGIFQQLPGLDGSPVRDDYIAAAHHATAEGICLQNHIGYMKACGMEEMRQGIGALLNTDSQRPVVLEVCTSAADDTSAQNEYYESIKKM